MKIVFRFAFSRVPLAARCLPAMTLLAITPVHGQLNLNAGATVAEALGGQWGVEGRVGFYPSGLPVDFFVGADYFFADCTRDCGLWGARAGGHLSFPQPGIEPFVSSAFLRRNWESGEETRTPTGWSFGVGFRVVVWKLRLQAELSRELLGGDLDQWVIRLGTG